MKKINYNIIVFAAAVLLIVGGWCSRTFLGGMKGALVNFVHQPNVESFVKNVDEAAKYISYQGALIDMTSLVNRLCDTRVVEKSDATVVRLDNNFLAFTAGGASDEELNGIADRLEVLKGVSDELEIPLLYVMAPAKSNFGAYPAQTPNAFPETHARYANILRSRGIHVLNLVDKMEEQDMSMESSFFITDHHWLPETGLWAAGEICQEMNRSYGFPYDPALTDISNYNVKVYQDVFLGSEGKKVGQYFTPLGLDDISVITPKFETKLTVEDTKGVREGTLADTMIEPIDPNSVNLYYDNLYARYSYGDMGLQVVQNHLSDPEAPKVVIIRDSFGSAVTPFLSLAAVSLHIIDLRHWRGTEEADTIYEYIRQEKPDCVLVLYTGLGHTMPEN